MKQKTHHWKLLIKQKSVLSLLITLGISLIIITYFLVNNKNSLNQQSTALTVKASIIDPSSYTPDSVNVKPNINSRFSLYDKGGKAVRGASQDNSPKAIFLSSSTGINAAHDFITSNPIVRTADGKTVNILPLNFDQNSILIKSINDQTDPFLADKNIDKNKEHFYYQQTIQGIPVYGADLAIHIKNTPLGGEVYGVSGSLSLNQNIPDAKISNEEARKIALAEASKEVPADTELETIIQDKTIFNLSTLDISDDNTNYLTLPVEVKTKEMKVPFDSIYFVELNKGKIVYSGSKIYSALNRKLNGSHVINGKNTEIKRSEGEPPTGDKDSDDAWNYTEDTYNFFLNNFKRDGQDGKGNPIEIRTHLDVTCPYASGLLGVIMFCPGLVSKDTVAHEYTHGVISSIMKSIIFSSQFNIINESISDIFGATINGDWIIGNNPVMLQINEQRYLNDPLKSNQPDKLFSPNYECDYEKDYKHINTGIFNYAFYLMSLGGNFNGCTISPLGIETSVNIVFRALATYLRSFSNFHDTYDAMNEACNDLYGFTSNICNQVRNTMQAVELDQQPIGEQKGAICLGLTEKTPECAKNNAVNITDMLTPTPSPQSQSCGNPCTKCILDKRSDLKILPFYIENGWTTECGNRDKIIENWCEYSPDCPKVKNGDCAGECN